MSAWTCRSTDGKAARKIVPPRLRIPYWKGLGADSEEKHEPVSDIDTVVVDSLKALDPEWPIREADIDAPSIQNDSGSVHRTHRPSLWQAVPMFGTRREFITLVGGGAAWPFAARAQQTQMHRVGALILGNADAEAFRKEMREGLSKAGYVEGRDVLFDIRSAQGRLDLLPKLASDLVAAKVDVIVALYTPCARAAQQATRDIP